MLDPEQNSTFNDHYLEVDFDLSDVMFVTTANSLHMPQPLMDRMEIIRIPGYTEDEKVEIAKRHLIPKEMKAHGLKEDEWKITDEGLRDLIRYYSREAGVRNLEREIANLTRKAVKEIVSNKAKSVEVTPENLGSYAGVRSYRYGEVEGEDQVGVVTGLAWTEVGGETLTIESVMLPGKGRFQATGKLGDVMKESIDAARSYVRSKATSFGIKPPLFDKIDIHVHVPEGATPKDGPSAGLAMATSIISVITGIPIRRDVAMTGEVTLRGRALPIGGLKEKLLAALRAGITTVIIPKENEKDLAEVPDNVKTGLKIVPVSTCRRGAEGRAGAPAGSDRLGRAGSAGGARCRWPRASRRRGHPLDAVQLRRAPDRPDPGPFSCDFSAENPRFRVFRLGPAAHCGPKVRPG